MILLFDGAELTEPVGDLTGSMRFAGALGGQRDVLPARGTSGNGGMPVSAASGSSTRMGPNPFGPFSLVRALICRSP
jgi:hypothetical protein